MKINYMFSRIDRDKGFNDNQKKYIKEDIKNNMSITPLVFNSSNKQ